MPHALYIFNTEEHKEFIEIISSIRTPTNYVGAIHKRLMDGKLHYMKTHDYHVLMQQILFNCIKREFLHFKTFACAIPVFVHTVS